MSQVVLVNMPYGVLERPSIALGNLKAVLNRAKISVRALYANLRFASRVGTKRYRVVGLSTPEDLLGEWTFSQAAFGHFEADLERYRREFYYDFFEMLGVDRSAFWTGIEYLRSQAQPFVEELAEEILASGAQIVGCTSTFQQHCASLALLRRLKSLSPSLITLMGGANTEGAMGLATRRNFPWVDYVVSGEAEELIVPLVEGLLQGQREGFPSGVLGAQPPSGIPRASLSRLDELPVPDFHDYFHELKQSQLKDDVVPALPVETSRGCWWGARHHCTFCGLNGHGMGYRTKSAQRALSEIQELSRTYQVQDFLIVDNILAQDYFHSLLPALAQTGPAYRFFVETKANLKRSQIEALMAAGFEWILPGLESLHDEVLKLMDKGTTGLINLQTLKWAREVGLRISWTILCGFPGERDEWYAEMAEWLPRLEHLQPPNAVCKVSYHRFSPYHERPQDYGVQYAPSPNYAYVYPLPQEEFVDLAYFFVDVEGSARSGLEGPGVISLRRAAARWLTRFMKSALPAVLSLRETSEGLEILDTRSAAPRRRHLLTGLDREVYLALDSQQSEASLRRSLEISADQLSACLDRLDQNLLILRVGDRILALATRGNLPALTDPEDFPGGTAGGKRRLKEHPWLSALAAP